MPYADAVQLCLRLYCTVDGVPSQLLPLSKERLGEAFSVLGRVGWVRGGWRPEVIGEPDHWADVMLAIFRGCHPDLERGEVLARQAGFVVERGTR